MDGNSSLERRYSFNIAQANPVAESTHLNGSSSFSWGSSMSPKHRSNSSLCLNNTHTPSVYNNKSIVSPKSKNITKIDARIAADVQSKGLASRIVKYHESGTRLNRSMSAHNLYSKPGQFPAVTLKKTDLPYRATKQELSMIRIAPPEKSSFLGNTISSLLRSSSVVGLQQSKRNEDLSRENRPIIHPPPTENDMAPTRSVLDVLKEISRKRINSDDLEVDETSKKYCNRAGNDSVDTGNNTTSAIPQHFLNSSLSCQRYKRQRDCITPHHTVQMPETRTSPEQAKKRVCNYNNDITSSLSSSIKCKSYGNAKRVSASNNLNQTMPTHLESYETQKAKMQRYHDHNKTNNTRVDVRFENLESTLRKVDNSIKPITPIPPTPCVQDESNIGGVPPMRTVSEPAYNSDRTNTMNLIQPANKPRLTLFNKKYDDEESTGANELETSVGENTDDFDECAGIPFVKPKKLSSISGLRNPVIERTQKSKLALMLSGLRGELYQNSDTDELDSAKEKPDKPDKPETPKVETTTSAVISALKSTSTVTTLTTVTSSSTVGLPNTNNTLNFSANTKTSSPLVGLKLSQSKVSSANVSSTLSTDATKSSETPKANVPVLGGFSFGTSNSNSTSVVNTTASNNTPKDTKTSEASIPSMSTSSSNAFSFGLSTQLTSKPSTTLDSNNTNKLQTNLQTSTKDNTLQFQTSAAAFTLATTKTTTAPNVTSSLPATSAFSFGANVTTPASTIGTTTPAVAATAFTSTVKPNNGFNFNVPSTSSLPVTTTSVAPIMFGTSAPSASSISSTTTTNVVPSTTTSAPAFGAVATSTNLGGLTSTTSFAFNAPKQSSTIQPTTGSSSSVAVSAPTFNFGSSVNAPSVPMFGANTNTVIKPQPTSGGFSFGSDPKTQNASSSVQNNPTAPKQPDNNSFNSNSPALFGSPAFNTPSSGSTPIFGNATNTSEKNVFNSSNATSIFGSNSVKGPTQTFGSNVDNKSAAIVTPSVFGGNSSNNSAPAPFSFGSKPAMAQTTNPTNTNASSGGFSFSSAVSNNNSENGTFAFGTKTDTTTSTSNNTFGGVSTSMQNKNFTFGSAATSSKPANPPSVFGGAVNKPTENTASSGGFSFGSAMAPKTSTFNFGASSNSFSGNNTSSNDNSASGFSFGAAAAIKPNEVSTNKAFSFGSSQAPQQQQQQMMSAPNNSNTNTPNIFGSNAASKTTPAPAFSFNSGSSTNIQPNAPASNNLFAPPPSTITTGPGDRPIRRATRRLQK